MTDALDVCECGDYRRDHIGGAGACKFNLPRNIGHGGPSNCREFRMSEPGKRAGPFHWRDGVTFEVESRALRQFPNAEDDDGEYWVDCVCIRQVEGYVMDREMLGEFVIPLDEWESIILGVNSQRTDTGKTQNEDNPKQAVDGKGSTQ